MKVLTVLHQKLKLLYPWLVVLAGCWAYGAYSRHRLRGFGVAYNSTRQQLGLPLVGVGWQEVLSDDEIQFVNPNHQAGHTRKRIVPSWHGPPEEDDLVFLPSGKGTLNMVFTGNMNSSTATLYGPGKAITMPYPQALDTLRKYELMR